MTFTTIADLLADPLMGKLEEVDQWDRWKRLNEEATLHSKPMSSHGAVIRADAALLAVANARGTCDLCGKPFSPGDLIEMGDDGDLAHQNCVNGEDVLP